MGPGEGHCFAEEDDHPVSRLFHERGPAPHEFLFAVSGPLTERQRGMEKEGQGEKDECSGDLFFIHGGPPLALLFSPLDVLFFPCLFRLYTVFLEPGPEVGDGDPPFFHESLLSVFGVAGQSNGQEFPFSRRAHPPAMKLGTETCHHEMMISSATGQRQGAVRVRRAERFPLAGRRQRSLEKPGHHVAYP